MSAYEAPVPCKWLCSREFPRILSRLGESGMRSEVWRGQTSVVTAVCSHSLVGANTICSVLLPEFPVRCGDSLRGSYHLGCLQASEKEDIGWRQPSE